MSPLTIIAIIVVIALVFFIMKYVFSTTNTLQGNLLNGKAVTEIDSKNLSGGGTATNFSYSVWFYVNDWTYKYGKPKILFARMNSPSDSSTSNTIDALKQKQPSPCVVLGEVENTINVLVTCFAPMGVTPTIGKDSIVDSHVVRNIPIQKWVNLSISVYDRTLDVYLDGKLVKTGLLSGTANVKPNKVYLTPNDGFDGWTSKFLYYPKPMNPQEAWNIYAQGPTGWMSNLSTYQIQLSLIENGTPQSSVTI